jgi:hypothetical protein
VDAVPRSTGGLPLLREPRPAGLLPCFGLRGRWHATLPQPTHHPSTLLQLLYDGQDAEAVRLLGTLRHVTLIHIHPPFAPAADCAKFELYKGGASSTASRQWGGQPGNFELMVKQG